MNMIRLAIYARVSTKPQAGEDKISIPDQLRECKAAIEREREKGWVFTLECIDPGITSATIDRPGLKKLFASMDQWDVVIVWDFDRLFREKRGVAGYILDALDANKKQITSVKQPIPIFDPRTYEPRENDTPYMLRELAGFTSGMDNRRRFRTLHKGRNAKLAEGYMMNSMPYGYRKAIKFENGKVTVLPREIVPEEAEIVRRMFREYQAGKGCYSIAYDFNKEKIPSPGTGAWSGSSVYSIMENPVYTGKIRTNKYKRLASGLNVSLPEREWRIIQGKHEPIISEELWQAVQEERKRRQLKSRAIGSPRLLSGLLKCGLCGWAMRIAGRKERPYYICNNRRNTGNCQTNAYRLDRLEKDVLDYLFRVLKDLVSYEKVRELQAKDDIGDIAGEIGQAEKTLAGIPARKSRIFELYEKEDITREDLLARREELAEIEADIRRTLYEKKQKLQKLQSMKIDRAVFDETIKNFEEKFEKADIAQKKAYLAAIVENISIKDRTFKVNFRYSS